MLNQKAKFGNQDRVHQVLKYNKDGYVIEVKTYQTADITAGIPSDKYIGSAVYPDGIAKDVLMKGAKMIIKDEIHPGKPEKIEENEPEEEKSKELNDPEKPEKEIKDFKKNKKNK